MRSRRIALALKLSLLAVLLATPAIIAGTGTGPAGAAFPGLNGKIAFGSTRDDPNPTTCSPCNQEIYVMNGDGSEVARLTNDPSFDCCPAWSPDGSQIAFASDRDGGWEIFVMDADGGGLAQLTDSPGHDFHPAWSPDGSEIVFTSARDVDWEIYIMNADGSGQRRVTNSPNYDFSPEWSPDGALIAFTSSRDGNDEVYVMNTDGSGQANLTNHAADDSWPAWSPDGTQIAFSSDRGGNADVFVMNADGSDPTPLTSHEATDGLPVWAPDGTKVCFSTTRDEHTPKCDPCNYEIYAMDVDGSGQTNLTSNPAFDGSPDWQPMAPVGGIAELPDKDTAPLETGGSSGPRTGILAGIAGAVAVALGGAAWWVRRRR